MAEAHGNTADTEPRKTKAGLESGTYEILRARLLSHGTVLRERIERLNSARKEAFGSIELAILATERITTENNCVPCDMIVVRGNHFLFGYNVTMGLKTETRLEDVFAVYEYRDRQFHPEPLAMIFRDDFERDFKELYKYYRQTVFSDFRRIGPHVYMAFRVGKDITDIKTFKWAVEADGLHYLGNRFDHEYRFPPQHDFEWKRAVRDFHRSGRYPHVSIEDRVFVETVGGDLTVKIEDNTESGEGIYSEPVDNPDQTLDDAEISYASIGSLILLKIKPFQERRTRYFIFNEKVKEVVRVDQIEESCVLLPDGHGIIFHNGYYLQTGEKKVFQNELSGMTYSRRIESPNGEDFLYVFYNRGSGIYVLLSYNRIEQKVETPIVCTGYVLFGSGEMVYFQCDDQPQKHHVLQIWQTPYVGRDIEPHAGSDSFLHKLGNPAIVGCMSECHEVLNLLSKEDTYENLYLDVARKTTTVIDTYFWLGEEKAFRLREPLEEIRGAANAAIAEFEKVSKIKRSTADEVTGLSGRVREIIRAIDYHHLDSINVFVGHLANLRSSRGAVVTSRELRYVDIAALDRLEKEIAEHVEKLSEGCVAFLLTQEALDPYRAAVEKSRKEVGAVAKVSDADSLAAELDKSAVELEMLIEIVSNLRIADATEATRIIDDISEIYAKLNQVRSLLKNRKRELMSVEGAAHFSAGLKLLSQSVTNYIDLSDTLAKCEEYLTKLMVQIEELEGRFADFEDFIVQIAEKREEIYGAFTARKVQITEARNRRAAALFSTAERVLNGIASRAGGIKTINELNGYFASDLMIEKVRDVARQLTELDDSVKAEEILGRLKTAQQESVRRLKDRLDLFVDGENILRFGKYSFTVNTQALDCTMIERDGAMVFHLTGTKYFEQVTDASFEATKGVWRQEMISEDHSVYRSEYLAWLFLKECEANEPADFMEVSDDERLRRVRAFMAPRYAEGYVKGVHDADALSILVKLLAIHRAAGLLKFAPTARGLGRLFWEEGLSDEDKAGLSARCRGFGDAGRIFAAPARRREYVDRLARRVELFAAELQALGESHAAEAAEYLFEELSMHRGGSRPDFGECSAHFVVSKAASEMLAGFRTSLKSRRGGEAYSASRDAAGEWSARWEAGRDWLQGFLASPDGKKYDAAYLDEAAVLLLADPPLAEASALENTAVIAPMVGTHAVIQDGRYTLDYLRFVKRLRTFERDVVPAYADFTRMKQSLLEKKREELRLEEYKPHVLTTFVRNQLIDSYFLPLIGANLAKQIGAAGEAKRTDRMGMLLLISPPGYGKTTLMEYVADRLGMTFMKVNGPALGHGVTSLDPAAAPNSAAREEVEKANLALEMGDNIMLYLDDIQHTNTEFLQKFISLCDAQRRIEGVWRGRARTYDLRGRKVMVVMAGNPYTESGQKFQIPDMLANRADTYNLGDIVSDNAEAFRRSYLENAVTSNPVLARLAQRSQKDVIGVIRLAEDAAREAVEFEGQYSPEEINEMVLVMRHLLRIRDVVLKVNLEYIRSAAQADAYRTEPPFKLQGSYRNMNRLAEKALPVMNDEEIGTILDDHYKNEAQTLTTGAEANLLKFRELRDTQDEADRARWEEIKRTFRRNLLVDQGDPSDPVGRVVVQLSAFREGLDAIRDSVVSAMKSPRVPDPAPGPPAKTEMTLAERTMEELRRIFADLKPAVAAAAGAGAVVEPGASRELGSGVPPQPPGLLDAQKGTPQFAGVYRDELQIPLGETRDFPKRTYTIRGNGFKKGAYLYIHDERHPVVVYDGQTVVNKNMLDPHFDGVITHAGEEIEFKIESTKRAWMRIHWKGMTNNSLGEPRCERMPFTIVNPDGAYAPYSVFDITITPYEAKRES